MSPHNSLKRIHINQGITEQIECICYCFETSFNGIMIGNTVSGGMKVNYFIITSDSNYFNYLLLTIYKIKM